MEKKQIKTYIVLLGTALGLLTSYLVYEAAIPDKYSLAYKMTHHQYKHNGEPIEVKDVEILNSKDWKPSLDEYQKIEARVLPHDSTYQDIVFETSDPELIEIKDDSFKIKPHDYIYAGGEPLKIIAKSKNNPDIYDEVTFNYKDFLATQLELIPGYGIALENPTTYNVNSYKPFKIDIKSFDSSNDFKINEVKVETSSNIHRLNIDEYYADSISENSWIAFTDGIISQKVTINVTETTETSIPSIVKFRDIHSNKIVDSSELLVGKTYHPYFKLDSDSLEYKCPFGYIIPENAKNSLEIDEFNNITIKKEAEIDIQIAILAPQTGPAIEQSARLKTKLISSHKVVQPVINNKSEFRKTIKLDKYQVYTLDIDFKDSTYTDYKIETSEDNIVTIDEKLHIMGSNPGTVTVTISPKDDKFIEEFKPIEIKFEVNPLISYTNHDKNIITGVISFITGVVGTALILMIYYNKKYLKYLSITYGIGTGVVTLYTLIYSLVAKLAPLTGFMYFGILLLCYFVGASIFYLICKVYKNYNGYNFEIRKELIDWNDPGDLEENKDK